MRKWIWLIAGVILAVLFAASWLLTPGQATDTEVSFAALSRDELPPEIKDWAESLRQSAGQHSKSLGNHTYLLVAAGERPTGGYTVKFSSVQVRGGRVVAQAAITPPPKDAMVTMAITYPYAVARIEKTALPVTFQVTEAARR